MTNPSDSSPEELVRLRECLNDVVSVMGLPAVWGGQRATAWRVRDFATMRTSRELTPQ